jgi:DNA-binding CsgD family transcriptional regulator
MIKSNLANKEISELLNLSCQTVEKHRKNIRKKLNLAGKKINLAAYLQKL